MLSYVGKPLTHDLATLRGASLSDALSGTKAEQQEATALLNLALSATQKEILFWLTHQPLLTVHQLAALHAPGGRDIRGVQQQLNGLSALHLLVPFAWYGARPWYERERYLLVESALRYSALREGRPATAYLLAQDKKQQYKMAAFAIQQGTGGLFWQMEHTHGLYTCIARLVEAAQRENIRIITWKNAREAIRSYPDPFTQTTMQIRPDAEVIYQMKGQAFPHCILVEYDRATTKERDRTAKYQTYADYLEYTRLSLPPILVITQHEQAATLIRTCIEGIGSHLPVVIILEEQVQRSGLLSMLALLGRSE
jgi:Replication-relaxation